MVQRQALVWGAAIMGVLIDTAANCKTLCLGVNSVLNLNLRGQPVALVVYCTFGASLNQSDKSASMRICNFSIMGRYFL
jgi:hypothetical protein